jgi:uncharacterized protein YfaS (alpha-2-macroglobulin family)
MNVGMPALLLRETVLGDVREAANDLLAGVNPQLLEGTGSVAVTISNTRLTSLRESITYLREYSYRCAEQTVSRLVPWAVRAQLGPVLPETSKEEIEEAIRAGVAEIFAMQTGQDGLSMWPDGSAPQLFPSAYAVLVLSMLEPQGVSLPAGWEQLLGYLSRELRGIEKMRAETQLNERTLALFALAAAGRAEPAYHAQLFRRRAELSRETRALLALAIIHAKGPSAMVDDLTNPKKSAPEGLSWFGGPARERAIQLMAWSAHKPASPEVGKLVKELQQFRTNGRWASTQDNAWALLALTRYFSAVERDARPVQGAVVYRDIQTPFEVTRETPAKTQIFTFDQTAPLAQLAVQNPGKGVLFSESRFLVRPPVGDQPRQDRGYAVARSYQKLAEDGSLTDIADLKVGDRVLVTLRVESPRPGHFVAIDDPVPSIFEPVNPSFESRAVGGSENIARDWVSDYREVRSDRVLIFCDSLPAGAFQFRYLARVRSAGTATAPSTKVEEMYRPERFGLSESLRVVSRAVPDK